MICFVLIALLETLNIDIRYLVVLKKIPVNSTNAETSLLRKFYVLNLLESIGYKLL